MLNLGDMIRKCGNIKRWGNGRKQDAYRIMIEGEVMCSC
jgi:hypothetical protein